MCNSYIVSFNVKNSNFCILNWLSSRRRSRDIERFHHHRKEQSPQRTPLYVCSQNPRTCWTSKARRLDEDLELMDDILFKRILHVFIMQSYFVWNFCSSFTSIKILKRVKITLLNENAIKKRPISNYQSCVATDHFYIVSLVQWILDSCIQIQVMASTCTFCKILYLFAVLLLFNIKIFGRKTAHVRMTMINKNRTAIVECLRSGF